MKKNSFAMLPFILILFFLFLGFNNTVIAETVDVLDYVVASHPEGEISGNIYINPEKYQDDKNSYQNWFDIKVKNKVYHIGGKRLTGTMIHPFNNKEFLLQYESVCLTDIDKFIGGPLEQFAKDCSELPYLSRFRGYRTWHWSYSGGTGMRVWLKRYLSSDSNFDFNNQFLKWYISYNNTEKLYRDEQSLSQNKSNRVHQFAPFIYDLGAKISSYGINSIFGLVEAIKTEEWFQADTFGEGFYRFERYIYPKYLGLGAWEVFKVLDSTAGNMYGASLEPEPEGSYVKRGYISSFNKGITDEFYGSRLAKEYSFNDNVVLLEDSILYNVLLPGQEVDLRLVFYNRGSTAWTENSSEEWPEDDFSLVRKSVRLGCNAPDIVQTQQFTQGKCRWFLNNAQDAEGAPPLVRSGEKAVFNIRLKAPSASGRYNLSFKMLEEKKESFGQIGNLVIDVVDDQPLANNINVKLPGKAYADYSSKINILEQSKTIASFQAVSFSANIVKIKDLTTGIVYSLDKNQAIKINNDNLLIAYQGILQNKAVLYFNRTQTGLSGNGQNFNLAIGDDALLTFNGMILTLDKVRDVRVGEPTVYSAPSSQTLKVADFKVFDAKKMKWYKTHVVQGSFMPIAFTDENKTDYVFLDFIGLNQQKYTFKARNIPDVLPAPPLESGCGAERICTDDMRTMKNPQTAETKIVPSICGCGEDARTLMQKGWIDVGSQILTPTSTIAAPPLPAPTPKPITSTPHVFSNNLWVGTRNQDVTKLQTFLAKDPAIYPERIATGYYGTLTQKAVRRFQCKHNIVCSGDEESTGYGLVGPKTREKLNEVYGGQSEIEQLQERIRQLQEMVNNLIKQLSNFIKLNE